MSKKKLGIALGGGGAWSIAGLGVIKVLEEEGIEIDYLAGCSMGALISAAYASQFAGSDTLKKVEEIIRNMRLSKGITFNRHKTFGLFSSDKIGEGFEKSVGKLNFEDLKIPVSVVATNFRTGEEVIFDKGPITPALCASASFAILFAPYEYQGKLLTDGGLSNPTPVDIVKRMGADVVIGIDVTSKNHLKRADQIQEAWHHKLTKYIPPLHYVTSRNVSGSFVQVIDMLFSNVNRYKLQLDPPDYLLIPEVTHMNQFGFSNAQEYMKQGEKVAREILPDLKKKLNG